MDETHEKNQNLLMLTVSPVIWGVHFLLSYITVAISCGKFPAPEGSLFGSRVMIAIYTMFAIIGIAMVARYGYHRHRHGSETGTHDLDTPEDRHRFLGFSILLLSGLSAVATLYATLVVLFIRDCN